MKIRKDGLTLNTKIAAIFGTIAIFTVICFIILYAFNKEISSDRITLDRYITLNHSFFKIQKAFENVKNLDDKAKIPFGDFLEGFEHDFKFLYKTQVRGSMDSLFNKKPSDDILIGINFSEEEEKLFNSYKLWHHLDEYADKIKFNMLSKDSSYQVYHKKELYNAADSSYIYAIENEVKTIKRPTKEAKKYFLNFEVYLKKLEKEFSNLETLYTKALEESQLRFKIAVTIICFFVIILLMSAFYASKKIIIDPLKRMTNKIQLYVEGDLSNEMEPNNTHELQRISQTFNYFIQDFQKSTKIVEQIKNGNLQLNINDETGNNTSRHNPLFGALKDLLSHMHDISQKETERNWIIEGQRKLTEVLSKNYKDFQLLADEVISQLVQFMNARQGGLFVVSESNDSASNVLDLVSCYAFDRKKYINRTIELGEGLIGQVWQEEKTIYIESIPEDHTIIKSGLGDSQPISLLIVPLIESNEVHGIIEIASFKRLDPYQVEFVEKIGENIASTLSSVKVNNKTQKLLSESQKLTEKMKYQEEQMRQSLSELEATQEEIKRREFQKEQELKLFAEKFDEEVAKFEERERNLNAEISTLKKQVEFAKTDNDKIREMQLMMEEHEKVKNDLLETIKIKDLRIEKMRKKLERLRG